MTDPRGVLAATPLPLLLMVPGTVGVLLALAVPERQLLALVLATVGCFVLGAWLSHQLRSVGGTRIGLSRDVARLHDRVAADRLRVALLEQLVSAADTSSDSSLDRTRALLAELVHVEESTRASMAAELHDTVAQTLSQALQQLGHGSHDDGAESVAEAEVQLRNVLARLRPPELADGDLAQAVHDLCLELEQRYGVVVDVTWPEESVALSSPLATTVYRFLQETLLNAAVHADGVDVRLDVVVEGTDLVATVSDGGAGFDPHRVRSVAGRHVGLQLARERARLAGGTLDISSGSGSGTTARLCLPLAEQRLVHDRRATDDRRGLVRA